MSVDVKELEVPELVKYARSVGVNPHGLNREALEDEIALATTPIVPEKENRRLAVLEDIVNAMSPVLQQLQFDMKKVQTVTGLRSEEDA